MIEIIRDPSGHPRLKETVSNFETADVLSDEFILRNSDGKLVAIYLRNFVKHGFGNFFNEIKFADSHRTSGLFSRSQIFGFAPRDDLKRLPARFCKFNKAYQKQYLVLQKLAKEFENTFARLSLSDFEKHVVNASVIPEAWRIRGSYYTSGIINLDTQYLYHTDNGNVANTLSSMLTFKHRVSGGDLHLPEYNVLIKTENNSLLIFDGANTSHGVTKFKKDAKDSYRITVVWYVLEKLLRSAATPELEIKGYNEKIANVKFRKN